MLSCNVCLSFFADLPKAGIFIKVSVQKGNMALSKRGPEHVKVIDTPKKNVVGEHYIVELHTNNRKLLDDPEGIMRVLDKAAKAGNLTVEGRATKRFHPQGFTAVYLLSESHLSIHTWPELGYAALDVYTCGGDAKQAVDTLIREFEATKVDVVYLERGPLDEG